MGKEHFQFGFKGFISRRFNFLNESDSDGQLRTRPILSKTNIV